MTNDPRKTSTTSTTSAFEAAKLARALRAAKAAEAAEAARKAAAAQEVLRANDADYRQFVKFQNLTGRRAIKTNEVTKACLKAIGENISHWLDAQSEERRAEVFAAIEFGATQADATRIAKHPLRPAVVAQMVEAMIVEAEAEKEAARQAATEAAAQNADKGGDFVAA